MAMGQLRTRTRYRSKEKTDQRKISQRLRQSLLQVLRLHLSGLKADAIINIQGDEPFVEAAEIEQLSALIMQPEVAITALAKQITKAEQLMDSSKVKVVMNRKGDALYFSRQANHFRRGIEPSQWLDGHSYYKRLRLHAIKS